MATDLAVIYPRALAFGILVLPDAFTQCRKLVLLLVRMDRNRFVKHADDKVDLDPTK